jgi:hypothetical protein
LWVAKFFPGKAAYDLEDVIETEVYIGYSFADPYTFELILGSIIVISLPNLEVIIFPQQME